MKLEIHLPAVGKFIQQLVYELRKHPWFKKFVMSKRRQRNERQYFQPVGVSQKFRNS